ncbi:hypothetical protein C8Q79DRAFT_484269 [Trametes meyenii]|nr:hypothetical protein C8Q79DRAFT_484269 [Trametes meyenii]
MISPRTTPAETTFSELLFPERLLLDFDDVGFGRGANWDAYRVAIETFLRLKGLEAHLNADGPPVDLNISEKRLWEVEDDLCASVIKLNIKGKFPVWLKRLEAGRSPAASLWKELCRRHSVVYTAGDARQAQRLDSDIINTVVGSFLALGMIGCLGVTIRLLARERR